MGIIENMKEITAIVKKIGDIDLYRRIMALEGEVFEISGHKLQLEQRVRELEASARLRVKMVFRSPVYLMEGDCTPFCPICFERDGRAVHLLNFGPYASPRRGPTINWFCAVCKEDFYLEDEIQAAK